MWKQSKPVYLHLYPLRHQKKSMTDCWWPRNSFAISAILPNLLGVKPLNPAWSNPCDSIQADLSLYRDTEWAAWLGESNFEMAIRAKVCILEPGEVNTSPPQLHLAASELLFFVQCFWRLYWLHDLHLIWCGQCISEYFFFSHTKTSKSVAQSPARSVVQKSLISLYHQHHN